jgi:hypothetical protein
MLENGELARYPHSTKPPGSLLFYMMTERGSRLFKGVLHPGNRQSRFETFISLTWPLIASLAIIFIFYLGLDISKESEAMIPPIFYLFLPNVILINLHLDQCLYPVLSALCVFLLIHSLVRSGALLSILAGMALYVSMYFSYSLLALTFFAAVFALFHLIIRPEIEADAPSLKERGFKYLKVIALWACGYFILYFCFLIIFGYEALTDCLHAMAAHQAWKGQVWSMKTMAHYGLVNLLEFFCWTGIPVAMLYFKDTAETVADLFRRKWSIHTAFSLAFFLTLMAMAFLGKTAGETARLWIFMSPFLVMLASRQALKLSSESKARLMLYFLLALQLATTLVIKAFQDFI